MFGSSINTLGAQLKELWYIDEEAVDNHRNQEVTASVPHPKRRLVIHIHISMLTVKV